MKLHIKEIGLGFGIGHKLLIVSLKHKYSWPLTSMGLNCAGPLTHGVFFFTINIFFLLYDFLFFSFIIRIQYTIQKKFKMCVNQLLMLLVRLCVNNRLFAVKFGRSKKLKRGFFTAWRDQCPNPHIFQGSAVYRTEIRI